MALSATNSNFISRAKANSQALLDMRNTLEIELGRWNLDDMYNVLTDNDVTAVFPGLDKGKVVNYINAIKAILVALGTGAVAETAHDDSSSQAANLIKMLE